MHTKAVALPSSWYFPQAGWAGASSCPGGSHDRTRRGGAAARAAQRFARAEEAVRAGRLVGARRLTAEIVNEYPSAPVSGRALLLNARAARDAGDATAADTASQRYLELLPAGDPRIASVRLLQAEAFTDDAAVRLDRPMRIPVGAPPGDLVRAASLAGGAADLLDPEQLEAARSNAPSDAALTWVLDVRAATARGLPRDLALDKVDTNAAAGQNGAAP